MSSPFLYQQYRRFFAQVADGLLDHAQRELGELGATEVRQGYRGLDFSADASTLYAIVYRSRLISRVLAPLVRFDCHSPKYLYRRAGDVRWTDLISPDQTFAVSAVTANSTIRHSGFAALRVKDAIADQFTKECGRRPNVDPDRPDLQVHLYLHRNKAQLALDVSGGSLHKRGYRKAAVEAPIQETVAAAIVRLTRWDGEPPLCDPFCGSGTLLSEALMHYARIPAGFLRRQNGLTVLPDYDEEAWQRMKGEADEAIRSLPKDLLAGSDADPDAVKAARTNLGALPGGENVEITRHRFEDLPDLSDRTIVCNPPHGIRLGTSGEAEARLQRFGDFLKQRAKGSTVFVFYGDKDLYRSLGLRPSRRWSFKTGGLDGRLCRYEIF